MAHPLSLLHAARDGYLRTSDPAALERGLAMFESADWTPVPVEQRCDALNVVAELRLRRYERDGDLEDLDTAISMWNAMLEVPLDESLMLAVVSNRATALAARFDVSGDLECSSSQKNSTTSNPSVRVRGMGAVRLARRAPIGSAHDSAAPMNWRVVDSHRDRSTPTAKE